MPVFGPLQRVVIKEGRQQFVTASPTLQSIEDLWPKTIHLQSLRVGDDLVIPHGIPAPSHTTVMFRGGRFVGLHTIHPDYPPPPQRRAKHATQLSAS